MVETVVIAAEPRERAGKGAARAARRQGLIPGVIYGAKKQPSLINLPERDLAKRIQSGGFFARLYDLEIGSDKERVLARDLQLDPVTDRPVHVDFLRVSASSKVTSTVTEGRFRACFFLRLPSSSFLAPSWLPTARIRTVWRMVSVTHLPPAVSSSSGRMVTMTST